MSEELEETQIDTTSQEVTEELETAVDAVESAETAAVVEEAVVAAAELENAEELEAAVDVAEESALLEESAEISDEIESEEEELDLEEAVAEEEVEEILIPDDGRAWFVVHCYSGYENKVRHSIEQRIETMDMQDKIFDVVVPTEEEIEIKDGKRRTVERRVFPGYILVQMLMSEDSWYVVRNTPGVTGFVGMGNDPTPLRPDEVAKIMNRMEAEAPKVKFDFQVNEKVRIGTGPFADFIGTVAEIDADRAKVRVMVSFFGRETPVELDFLHVEKV